MAVMASLSQSFSVLPCRAAKALAPYPENTTGLMVLSGITCSFWLYVKYNLRSPDYQYRHRWLLVLIRAVMAKSVAKWQCQ
jgi:hypothetical protein